MKSATVRDIGKVCAIFNQKLKCNTCQEQCVLIKLTKELRARFRPRVQAKVKVKVKVAPDFGRWLSTQSAGKTATNWVKSEAKTQLKGEGNLICIVEHCQAKLAG